MLILLKKFYNYFFLQNKIYIKFIFKSFNKIKRKGYDFTIDERLINQKIYLDEAGIRKNYKNYFLLIDRNYQVKSFLKKNYKKIFTTFNLKSDDFKNSLFFIYFQQEDFLLKELENIINNGGDYQGAILNLNEIYSDFSESTSYRFINTDCLNSIKNSVKNLEHISHLSNERLNTHENICEGLELTKKIDGDYVEIGVYKGGSALTALNYLKLTNQNKFAYLIDTFEGFNYEESKNSSDIAFHDTHFISKDIQNYMKEIFKGLNNYELIKGNITKDNIPDKIKKISLANIDVDLQEATYEALIKVSKRLSLNGIIMCEDPVHTPGLIGAKYAMEKFLMSEEGKDKYLKVFKKNHYFLIRIR